MDNERFIVNPVDEKGLRIVTSGGNSCGLDGSLWLVEEVCGKKARENVEGVAQYVYRAGVVRE